MEKKDIEIPFGAFDSELGGFEYTIPEGYKAEIKDGKVVVRKTESEDEKISKEIIDIINSYDVYHLKVAGLPSRIPEYIAWIEKQGNLIVELQKTYVEIGKLVKEICYLKEKQGEQKPVEWSGVDNAIVEGICLALEYSNESGETIEKYENWLHSIKDRVLPLNEVLKQKPVDRVKPKFKVGDWIVFNGLILYVNEVVQSYYRTISKSGIPNSYDWDIDNIARLWTIQDAKDGDVLFTSSTASHETFIFKSIDEKGNVKCYFAYDSEDGFREGKYHFIGRAVNCKPATKEQRDLLFQKMHEAGYKWNAEKKELKKIEQNTACEIVPNFKQGDIIKEKETGNLFYVNSVEDFGYTLHYKDCIAKGCTIDFKYEDNYELVEPKSAWSEEDETMLERVIKFIPQCMTAHGYNEYINWFKSLKDRVQPKQEWSEEDEQKIGDIRDAITLDDELEESYKKELYDFLNSLRPQNRWKPSDEQIKAFDAVLVYNPPCSNECRNHLITLYNDLKKLMEE